MEQVSEISEACFCCILQETEWNRVSEISEACFCCCLVLTQVVLGFHAPLDDSMGFLVLELRNGLVDF